MNRPMFSFLVAVALAACAPAPAVVAPVAPVVAEPAPPPPVSGSGVAAIQATDQPSGQAGLWLGAAAESDFLLNGSYQTMLGIWVDVPSVSVKVRAPADVALVIDMSGSMAGPKIDNARGAGQKLLARLADGDVFSFITFNDSVSEPVPPTILDRNARPAIHRVIGSVQPVGGTNMFDGLRLAENRVGGSPPTHPVRRIVMISDGMANVGPSSPEALGAVAARGADNGVQVSAIGVGADYDERTLNALAVRSSGRLYHIDEPSQMAAILDREMGLLQTTAATAAYIEVVPAPGARILGADGVRVDTRADGSAVIPLGTMFGGQHREMLLRLQVSAEGSGSRALASVRLHFKDPADGGLSRLQEVVARYQVTTDRQVVAAHVNEKTRTIMASQQAAQITIQAAQQINVGSFDAADKQLAEAEIRLNEAAARAKDATDRRRVTAQAQSVAKARASAKKDAAAPPAARPAAQRRRALDINHAGMEAAGY